MSSALVLIILLRIAPIFFDEDAEYIEDLIFLTDQFVIILQAGLILYLVWNIKPFNKHVAMIGLVVSLGFLINFYYTDEVKEGYFNYVSE